jgi:hypothetical protein
MRTQLFDLNGGHGGANSKLTGLIVTSGDNSTLPATDGDRDIFKFRTFSDFNGSKESVHIEMNDFSHKTILRKKYGNSKREALLSKKSQFMPIRH